jgi:hypothetical protein
MRFIHAILLIVFSTFAAFPVAAQERPFAHREIAKDADRYEAYIRANWKPATKKSVEVRLAAEKKMATDPRAASRDFAAAVATDPKSAESWFGLARALLAIKVDPNAGSSEQYDLPVNASGAAYRAYERATDKVLRAKSLAVLSEALQRRFFWRPAIESLKSSLSLVDDAKVREAYEKLRAEHGFRMTDYSTESEQANPRVCLQFSEQLSRTQSDFSKFVAVSGKDPQGLTAESQQICFEGLKHGERYEVLVRAGLPSDVGEVLEKPVTLAIYVPDRKPFVRFSGKNYVLPSSGQQGIPVVTVNTSKVAVEVYRIGDRNLAGELESGNLDRQLSSYEFEDIRNSKGTKVYKGELEVATKLNQEVTTAVPVNEAVGTLAPGAYVMIAEPIEKAGEYAESIATQWFIVSDLGLTAFSGTEGIHGFVRSLATTKPIEAAEVRLVARNNEILARAKTDEKGYVKFESGLAKGEGGLEPAILIAENGSGEYAFLDLRVEAFDLSDRGVTGREAPGPLDAYLYTERGVYRPGEEVNLTALIRDRNGIAATLPVMLIVTRPDGVEYGRYSLPDEGLGGRSLKLSLSSSAQTGTWRARVHSDPKADALNQVAFLVEDFVPERLDMTLEEGSGKLAPDEEKWINITGRYLYGPPAAGLSLEGDILVRPAKRDMAQFPGFKFGLADEKIEPVRKTLENVPMTGEDGKAEVALTLPAIPRTVKPLEADILMRLREAGGRTIERAITLPVETREPRIGIKPLFANDAVNENEKASFEVVLLDADGKPKPAAGLLWSLVRLDTTWQWYSRDGNWSYEPQTFTRKVADGTLDIGGSAPASLSVEVGYGRYRLEIASAEAGGPVSSAIFNAGWYTAQGSPESPEILDVALDKASYTKGDTAKLRIASKTGGKALVTVLGSDLHAMKEVDLPKGGGDVELIIDDNWGPGAYATVLLYRPMDEKAKRMPSRAIGITWIGVDQSSRTLKISMASEAKIRSGGELRVPVTVTGLESGEEARLTVAAVDLGILNLTKFQAPAPDLHFYAQRKLALEIRDFYGRLIDGMRAERGALKSGGDGSDDMSLKGSPPVEELVAFYSGIVTVGADGKADVAFQLPGFNGTVHLMAVAWSNSKVGHATGDVVVRDAIALTAAAPRFMTLGDEVSLDISTHNVEGPAGRYTLSLVQQPMSGNEGAYQSLVQRTIDLKAGERRSEVLKVKPAEVGLHSYEVHVAGGADINVKRQLVLDVKPPAGDIKRTTVATLSAKGGKITLSPDLVAGLIAERTRVMLTVGPAARFDVAGLLTALDRYPYGCAEQTVSRALPLLYANAVAAQVGIAPDKEIKERIQGAVERVFQMQDSSGNFGSWGPNSDMDVWLTSYVTDFLTRARENGFNVHQIPFNQALDRLQNYIANASDFDKGGEERAYALYVLARNGRAPIGELRYYADTRLDRFSSPLARAQLGASLAMMGDKERAETAFKSALQLFDDPADLNIARADYGSRIRDGAALVTLASETGIAKQEAPRLINVVAKAYQQRSYTSTQEQAWMLLAANALSDAAKNTELNVGGAPLKGPIFRGLDAETLLKGPLVIENMGDEPVDAVVTVIGAGMTPEPPVSKGFKIARSYYTLDGQEVDLASAKGGAVTLKQNDRLVTVVRIESDEAAGRVLLVDRLPSGFQIENPRLVDSGDISSLTWLKSDIRSEHAEFRDDRFVSAFNLFAKKSDDASDHGASEAEGQGTAPADPKANAPAATATVAYIVRAVTPGTFVHPAATVEDMYRPERYARSAGGTLAISASQ